MTTENVLIVSDWAATIADSNMQKKDGYREKGWMALRGNWGRKKRSVNGSNGIASIHRNHSSGGDYLNFVTTI